MVRFDVKRLLQGRTPQERVAALNLRPDLARAAVQLVADVRSDAEVKRLNPLLRSSESVMMLVEGRSRRAMGLHLLSSERMLIRPHGEGPTAVVTTELSEISATESNVKSMTGRLALRTADSVLEVDRILGSLADQFAQAVRALQETERSPAGPASPDPWAELVELRSRMAAGAISIAEYEAAKARLLDQI